MAKKRKDTQTVKVRLKEDIELFGRKLYAGEEVEVSKEVYETIAEKVEVLSDADTL